MVDERSMACSWRFEYNSRDGKQHVQRLEPVQIMSLKRYSFEIMYKIGVPRHFFRKPVV